MLFFSYFKELVGKEVMVELKNDLTIRGTLHSVDQYLNIKLENIKVVDEDKYPHMSLLIYGDPLHFRLRKSKTSSDPVIFRSCFISCSRSLRCLCSADPKGTGSRPDEIVSDMLEKLLQREENKALVDGLEKASARVDREREALADIERRKWRP
ncbi:hypothetical protein ZIOFF_006210 [Zingiber officinale]|uniref:Sm domain-containing protein n=1 Tax=Zingiber officinale TaxID=94328 RepID=A0A8J5HYV2_ZINOF|nr:hypothetical protein ZIOFF_006210 [Zingiber officinale]